MCILLTGILLLRHESELQLQGDMAKPCGSAQLVQPCVPTDAIHFHFGCQSMECSWVSKFLCGVASVSMVGSQYRKHGLTAIRLPPNSGDFNPIETVWGRLRRDLALREFEDLKHDKVITTHQFKQRVAQLLHSYSLKGPGEEYSYLEKLVRGMPARLLRCKKNKYGPCGE